MNSLLLAALLMSQGAGPGSARLSGVVYDEQRGAVPRAAVEITCGSERRSLTATQSGEFLASGLPLSTCSVTASAPLFEPAATTVDLVSSTNVALVLRVRTVEVDVTVTASRGLLQSDFDVPQAISTTTRADIDSRPYQLLPQVLREEPGILLQQTTSGQASPIIRGFTGQSNVYLLDGVRLNTSAWRSGPSQYFAWVEPGAVERIDIVRGPGSVQYGSDALGGTINVLTNAPAFSASGLRVGGSADAMAASADRSGNGAANLFIQGPAAAFRFGLSTRQLGDLRGGGGQDSHAAVTRFLGLRSDTLGRRMRSTGFDQRGGYVTGSIRAGNRAILNTLFIHENQTDVGRYDRTLGGDGLYRSGFDPQTLDFASVKYGRLASAGLDELSGTISFNRQADGRFEQTRPTAIVDAQRAVTTSYGYQVEGRRRAGSRHRIGLGAEIYDELTKASREQTNPLTGAVQVQRPDIPDGTGYSTFGAFIQDSSEIVPGRVVVQGGLRYGRFSFSTTPDSQLGVTKDRVVTDAVTYQLGTVIALSKQFHLAFSASRGFRAANAADLGSVGLTGGGGFEIAPANAAALGGVVGSTATSTAVSTGRGVPQLGPEVVYAYEPSIKFQSDRLSMSLTGFDLEYRNAIQRRAIVFPSNVVGTTISGFTVVRQDTSGLAYISQDIRPIATRVNLDRARILGFEAQGSYRINAGWRARAYYSMSNGRLDGTGEYLRRMPPPLGGASLRWSTADDGRWVEGVVSFAQEQTRLNAADLGDARIGGLRTRASIASYFNGTASDLGLVVNGLLVATGENLAAVQNRVLGTAASAPLFTTQPGFVTLGLRAGWRIRSMVEVTAIGENLTDRNYRLYGSGVDAPGANLQLRVRYRF